MLDIERGDWIRFMTDSGIKVACVEFISTPDDKNGWKLLYITQEGNILPKNVLEVRKPHGAHVVS